MDGGLALGRGWRHFRLLTEEGFFSGLPVGPTDKVGDHSSYGAWSGQMEMVIKGGAMAAEVS